MPQCPSFPGGFRRHARKPLPPLAAADRLQALQKDFPIVADAVNEAVERGLVAAVGPRLDCFIDCLREAAATAEAARPLFIAQARANAARASKQAT